MTQNRRFLQANLNMVTQKVGYRSTIRKGPRSVSLKRTLSFAKHTVEDDPNQSKSLFTCIFKVVDLSPLWEKCLLLLGCFLAMVNGCCWPLVNLQIARLANMLSVILISYQKENLPECSSFGNGTNLTCQNMTTTMSSTNLSSEVPTEEEWNSIIERFSLITLATALLLMITGFFYNLLLGAVSERIVMRLRKRFFHAMLRQNIAWFDARSQGELTNYVLRNMSSIQTALGVKLGMLLMCVSEITCSLIISFYSGWKLTLVLACAYPILVIIAHVSNQLQHKMNKVIRVLHGELSTFLQEIFAAVKTVMAFGGEEKEFVRFLHRLRESRKENMKQTVISAMNFSIIFLVTQCFTALGFWYGMHLMNESELTKSKAYQPTDVIVVNVMVLLSGVFIRLAVPLIELVANGFSAAVDIVAVLERNPEIDSYSESGVTLQQMQGEIEFSHIHFWYPTSVGEKKILKGMNLRINAGETVALVGPSGGGKSTILQLIQRFYDPQKGKVKIDDKNLQEFNLGWFRRKIGIVSQEPSLFNTTIRENIRYGYEDATEEEIIRSAKESYAHEFIMKLPQQYDTVVGEQGGQLSGGERQRIAIARALVRNPTILLLDEATSALDNESEVMVQNSLERARSGRTTIIIAHRLSTIRNVDRIVGIKGGKVIEQGTHEELLKNKNGVYYQLLQSQTGEKTERVDDDEDDYTDEESQADYVEEDEDDDSDVEEYLMYEPLDTDEEKKELSRIKKSFWKILLLSKDDWIYIIAAFLFSTICGVYHPARCIVFAKITDTVVMKDFSHPNKIILFPCLYAVIGFIAFVSFSLRGWSYSRSEENLLFNVRQKALKNMLRQEVGWYDDPQNNLANLVSLVTVEAEHAKFIPGTIIGTWVYTFVATAILVAFSLCESYKLALAVGSVSVFAFFTQYIQQRVARGGMISVQSTEEKANNIAMEAIRNIRTVISLHIEEIISKLHSDVVGKLRRIFDSQLMLRAVIAASADGMSMLGYIVGIAYGSYLMYQRELTYFGYNVIQSMLIVNIMEVAQALAVCPSYTRACMSAYRLRRVMKRKPLIDTDPAAGLKLPKTIDTRIVFRDVRFAYPTRPTEEILQGLNITIKEGQTVAFVGKSGCGKSTAFQLLQRFYDPPSGSVALSGYDLRCLNIPSLRSLIGVVSQQPTLFNRTIAENIAYGDNSRTICMHEIIDAARQANIHDFIITLRQGYETRLGQRGVQLSGGQKQRVAIARALVRNPKILLLDEATSALDNESEKIVQEALEKAREGRTCLIIAHRLSTVQNADQIAVFDRGHVAEQGTPKELLDKQGLYYEHLQIQQGHRRRLSRPLL